MKRIILSMVAALALSSTLLVHAQNASFVPSTEASRNAAVATKGMHWYTNLEEAQAEARKSGKMVFWMHMLGTIDGVT